MKSIGIVRNLDFFGRVVIPSELRERLDMNIGDPIEVYSEGDLVILKKYEPDCIFCGEAKDVSKYKGKDICKKCKEELENYDSRRLI